MQRFAKINGDYKWEVMAFAKSSGRFTNISLELEHDMLEAYSRKNRLGTLPWKLSLGNYRLVTFVWGLSAWDLPLWNSRFGFIARELSPENLHQILRLMTLTSVVSHETLGLGTDLWLGILGFGSLARVLWLGIFGLGSLAWVLWLWIFGLGSMARDLWLGIFGFGSLALNLWLRIFDFGSSAVDLWLWIFRLRSSAWIFGLGSWAWGTRILRLGEPPGRFRGNPAGQQATPIL